MTSTAVAPSNTPSPLQTQGEDEAIAKIRQDTLWKIFDDYYAQLPDRMNETDNDKSWSLSRQNWIAGK